MVKKAPTLVNLLNSVMTVLTLPTLLFAGECFKSCFVVVLVVLINLNYYKQGPNLEVQSCEKDIQTELRSE